jgi:hypothetical protein
MKLKIKFNQENDKKTNNNKKIKIEFNIKIK